VSALLLALEVAGNQLPSNDNRTPFAAHPERGWTLPASTTFQFVDVASTTNRLGLRSPEPATNPELRILTLGDSTTFGHGVQDHETFSARLAQDTGVDVQNGGVPGYTCLQSMNRYNEVVDHLNPDILLIYTLHNDVRKLVTADDIWVNRAATLGIFRLLSTVQRAIKIRRGASRVSVSAYRSCLTELIQMQDERGGRSLLLAPLEPKRTERHTRRPPRTRRAERRYQAALDEVAATQWVPLLDLTTTIWDSDPSSQTLMLDPVHPNVLGHQRVASAIRQTLTALGVSWPVRPSP